MRKIYLGHSTIMEVPEEKFYTGFFDQIAESQLSDGEFYLSGRLEGFNGSFISETYQEIRGINAMIENGDMLENGLLACNVPEELPEAGEL